MSTQRRNLSLLTYKRTNERTNKRRNFCLLIYKRTRSISLCLHNEETFFCSHTKEREASAYAYTVEKSKTKSTYRRVSSRQKVPIGERIRPCLHNEETFVYSEKHPPMLTQRRNLCLFTEQLTRSISL